MLRRWLLGGVVVLLAGCVATKGPVLAPGEARVIVKDSAQSDGGASASFFFLSAADGAQVYPDILRASLTASSGMGRRLIIKDVEREIPARTTKLTLVGQYSFAAPIENMVRTQASYRVEGEVLVDLQPNVRYRVNGALDSYRREVWLEEEATGRIVGTKVVNTGDIPATASATEAPALFTCCNLRYEGDWISDLNAVGLPFVPAGARIAVKDYGRHRAHVLIDGRPMRIGLDYGREQETKEQYVAKLMLKENPVERIEGFPAPVRAAIREGKLVLGMTRDQVIIALGYPRTDETHSLTSREWKYWTVDGSEFVLLWDSEGRLKEVDAERRVKRQVIFSE